MKFIGSTLLLLCAALFTQAQLTTKNFKEIKKVEEEIKTHANKILYGIEPIHRLQADSIFTRGLVQALKVPHSFNYKFDSLFTISQQYPSDSSFRIFTWQLVINEDNIRQRGAIQMKTKDGSLKLFPLIDKSEVTPNIDDTITNRLNWIGAIYYKIIKKERKGKPVYTLLGYDEHGFRSSKKIIEILEFKDDEPVFGGRYFIAPNDKLIPDSKTRYIMEFKKDAGPRLAYDAEMDMIIMEHLISETNEPGKKYTLIGDGDYEGFKWINGKWTYINKVFTEVTPEGQPPTPSLILDAEGNIDETKVKGYEPPVKAPK